MLGPDLAEDPADVAEDPQRQADEERIPEEPLHAQPLTPAAEDDDARRHGKQEQPGITVNGLGERIAGKDPAEQDVNGQVQHPSQGVSQGAPR